MYIYIYISSRLKISQLLKNQETIQIEGLEDIIFFTLEKSEQNKAFPRKFFKIVLYPLKIPRP